MTKLILMSTSMLVLMNSLVLMSTSSLLIMFSLLFMFTNYYPFLMNKTMLMDTITFLMIMLTTTSSMLISISSSTLNKISMTIIPITIILILTFMSLNMINFYIMFELVLIPTMILILTEGKQPERLQASIYLIMYTITASLPLLISIVYMNYNPSFILSAMMMMNFNMPIMVMLAFLVKTPMYFTHLWLPKAHVEAPLEGSMILAAILLKLGGYGILRFLPLCIKKINFMNYWIISISMIGATATSLNCTRQKDLKSLIAYSSVAHMGMVLMGIFSMNMTGLLGAMIMMIAHGLSSSALFFLVNDTYMKYHSRNTLLFKGMMLSSPNIMFWWFMFMSMNISAPPSINTMSEILMMSSLINWELSTILMIFSMSIMTMSFSMMMYINISNNKNSLLPSFQTHPKSFMSLFLHMIPLMLMLLKMEMLTSM